MSDSIPVALAVPVFHGADILGRFLDSLDRQDVSPSRCLFIDSSTDDKSSAVLKARGHDVLQIPSASFDHGGTRNLALDILAREGFRVVVFMTQDAAFASSDSLRRLIDPFTDPAVGACFGRQLPRRGAGLLERVNREVRYPAESYRANDLHGQRRYFNSNAFAAYRADYLTAVGAFPAPSLFAEDAVASFRLQQAGFQVRYEAGATVEHSHPVRLGLELRRFFDVGVASRQPTMPPEWGSRGSGARSTLTEWRLAWRLGGLSLLLHSIVVSLTRAIGMTLGRMKSLPPTVGRRLAYSKAAYESVIAGIKRTPT